MKAQFIVTIEGSWLEGGPDGDKRVTKAMMQKALREAVRDKFEYLAKRTSVKPYAPEGDREAMAVSLRDAAMEYAAVICEGRHHDWKWDDEPDSDSGPRDCARAIRAAITSSAGEVKP